MGEGGEGRRAGGRRLGMGLGRSGGLCGEGLRMTRSGTASSVCCSRMVLFFGLSGSWGHPVSWEGVDSYHQVWISLRMRYAVFSCTGCMTHGVGGSLDFLPKLTRLMKSQG